MHLTIAIPAALKLLNGRDLRFLPEKGAIWQVLESGWLGLGL